ncbi:hypothetical protein QW131_31965 [Roseibium salinum]|nr:hypothetical protein [Roseibium salinum]
MDAPAGRIGADGAAINVDLVSLVNLDPNDPVNPASAAYDPAEITVDGAEDVFLDLKARDRIFTPESLATSPLTQVIDHIHAGGDVDLVLQVAERERFKPASGFVLVRAEDEGTKDAALSGYVEAHYRDDLMLTKPDGIVYGDTFDSKKTRSRPLIVSRRMLVPDCPASFLAETSEFSKMNRSDLRQLPE